MLPWSVPPSYRGTSLDDAEYSGARDGSAQAQRLATRWAQENGHAHMWCQLRSTVADPPPASPLTVVRLP